MCMGVSSGFMVYGVPFGGYLDQVGVERLPSGPPARTYLNTAREDPYPY